MLYFMTREPNVTTKICLLLTLTNYICREPLVRIGQHIKKMSLIATFPL